MPTPLEQNTITLEAVLATVNALPEQSVAEDLSAELNEYNRLISELEAAINTLPNAGSGTITLSAT